MPCAVSRLLTRNRCIECERLKAAEGITSSTMPSRNAPVTRGTGNVFADLRFPDAAERQAKLRLACALNHVLEARDISQADAAKVLGVTQPKVSALRHYKLAGFSVERLMNLIDGPRPGRRDRDSAKASDTKSRPDYRRYSLSRQTRIRSQ